MEYCLTNANNLHILIASYLHIFDRRCVKLKFYNVKTRESVEVDEKDVTVVTMKNGRKAAKALVGGMNLFKILSKDDAARLGE